jgi:hypothetical protein
MGDALESVAVFDPLYGQTRNPDTEGACAFVAAESMSLLSLLAANANNSDLATEDPFLDPSTYVAIESALLYMIGGFDANASTVVRSIVASRNIEAEGLRRSRIANAQYVLFRLLALCRGEVGRPREDIPLVSLDSSTPNDYDSLP